MHWPNCITLLKRDTSSKDSRERLVILLRAIYLPAIRVPGAGRSVDFRKNPKNPRMVAAKKAWSAVDLFDRNDAIERSMSMVIGSFCTGGLPCKRPIPLFINPSSQFSDKGLGCPASR